MKKVSIKVVLSLSILVFSVFFAIPSFINKNSLLPDWWTKNQIKLGLDLQGGSQLLLQVETDYAINEKLQNFAEDLRSSLKKEKILTEKISLAEERIIIETNSKNIKDIKKILREFDYFDYSLNKDKFEIFLSEKFIKDFKNSLMLQSLEIIRKRVDEVGTNEPIIQIQGKQRVLVQLPGLKNPDRIKNLLGKTAKMNFRMVDEKAMSSISDKNILLDLRF